MSSLFVPIGSILCLCVLNSFTWEIDTPPPNHLFRKKPPLSSITSIEYSFHLQYFLLVFIIILLSKLTAIVPLRLDPSQVSIPLVIFSNNMQSISALPSSIQGRILFGDHKKLHSSTPIIPSMEIPERLTTVTSYRR
jgi:hypothetical protein